MSDQRRLELSKRVDSLESQLRHAKDELQLETFRTHCRGGNVEHTWQLRRHHSDVMPAARGMLQATLEASYSCGCGATMTIRGDMP